MTSPADIVSAVVNKLKAISTLVTAMGASSSNIIGHDQTFPAKTFQEALYELSPPGILVSWRGIQQGVGNRLAHNIVIIIRPASGSTFGSVIGLILDSVPTGSPVKFLYDEPHASVTQPENVRAEITQLLIGDNPPTYLEVAEISFTLTEKRS